LRQPDVRSDETVINDYRNNHGHFIQLKAAGEEMKAVVDKKTCIGCGLCADECSAVFKMGEDVAVVIVNEVPADAVEDCKEAAQSCPVEAIKLQD
jgi:ferredoxin